MAGPGWLQNPDEVGEKTVLQVLARCFVKSKKYISHRQSILPQNSERFSKTPK